jgi:class 3 adenylate cyclase
MDVVVWLREPGLGQYETAFRENEIGEKVKYMGDGVLVYFGYPQAHEDDAERAVRAGLDMRLSLIKVDLIV